MTTPIPPAPPSSRAAARGAWRLAGVLAFLLLAGLACLVLRQYSIKAFSDPYNWLTYARDLAQQFWVSRWPVTYPAFLWVMLKILGPYAVFLSNLPVLLLLLVLAAALAYTLARDTEERELAVLVGVGTLGLLAGFRPSLYVYLANPYRDPLSHVLLLAATLCFVRFTRSPGRGLAPVACAGLLLGLAASIREPAVLMMLPLALAALVTMPLRPFRPLAVAALTFGLFCALGLSPLLFQMQAATDQLLLPPQVVREGALLPGFDTTKASLNLGFAVDYYRDDGGLFWGLALLAGVGAAALRRNRLLLALALPALVVYAVVYTHYRSFVERYFFIVTLWAAPLAVYGLHQVAAGLLRMLRRPQWARAAQTVLACAIAAWALFRVGAEEPPDVRFRIADARAFTRDLQAVVPAGSFIICPRNLCEIISYFTHAQSEAATALVRDDPRSGRAVWEHYQPMLAAGRPVFFLKQASIGDKNDDEHLVRRFFDLEPAAELTADHYNLQAITGSGRLQLFRVKPWTALTARFPLPPDAGGAIVQVDAGRLSAAGPARTLARVSCDGLLLDPDLRDGIHYYRLPANAQGLEIASDAPVSSTLTPQVLKPGEPLNLNFGVLSGACHDNYLSDTIRDTALREPHARAVCGEGTIDLPSPWPPGVLLVPRLMARGSRLHGTDPIPLEVEDASGVRTNFTLEDSGVFRPLRLPTQSSREGGSPYLRLRTPETGTRVELDRLLLYPLPPAQSLVVDVGEDVDFVYLEDGFYRAEKRKGGASVRWTTGRATMGFSLAAPLTDVLIRLTYFHQERPRQAPPGSVQLLVNDHPLPADTQHLRLENGMARLEAQVRAADLRPGLNRLTLIVPPWCPRDYGSSDGRQLGIMLDRLEIIAQTDNQAPP
jgi:hypothetical protein